MAALDVKITKSGTSYYLRCENVEHVFMRTPVQAGLPTTEGGAGPILTIDLGVQTQQITIEGVVDTTGSGTNPGKAELENVALTWWAYGDDSADLPVLEIPPSSSYSVVLKQATFRQEGSLEDRWRFTILFLVRYGI